MILGVLHSLGAASRRVAAELASPRIVQGYLESRGTRPRFADIPFSAGTVRTAAQDSVWLIFTANKSSWLFRSAKSSWALAPPAR